MSMSQARKVTPRRERCTDLGNAKRFVQQHKDAVRYCKAWERWLIWDGMRWARDEKDAIYRQAEATASLLWGEFKHVKDKRKRDELYRHAQRTESVQGLRAMLDLASKQPGIAMTPDQFDANPWLLNTQKGVLDLRTGKVRLALRGDYLTRCVSTYYDPEATCPRWLEFLKRITNGDNELERFLQRAVGYTLTGSASEQVLLICYGGGANGKSTFLNTITDLLGEDYASPLPPDTLLKRGGRMTNDLAGIQGKRMVTAIEVEQGQYLAENLVKQLTGEDPLQVRFLYQEFFTMRMSAKLYMAVNDKPRIAGRDPGIWRRVRLIPFTVTIPPEEQDRELREKLKKEFPGILRWAVEGCTEWRRCGLGQPPVVEAATQVYREEMDSIGRFVKERLRADAEAFAYSGDIYQAYAGWCEGWGETPESMKAVMQRLRELGCIPDKDSKGHRLWRGVGFQPEQSGTADTADTAAG